MITKHKEVYFKTIIWHICYCLFHMGVYLATKDMDAVVYFYVNIFLGWIFDTGVWSIFHSFQTYQLFSFTINSAENDPSHKGAAQNAEEHLERHFKKLIKSLL